MKKIENEWSQIAGPMKAQGAPDEVVRQFRGVFLTGMLVGLDIKLVSKKNIKEAVDYLTAQLGELMLMEVGTDASSNQ
jgi:hypothetical protein